MIKTPTYRGRSVFLCQYFVLCEAKLPFLFFLLFYLFIWKRQFERRENREERKEKRTKKKRQSSAENCRFFLVRATGLEPARRGHQILSLARLPIPPRPHSLTIITQSFHIVKREKKKICSFRKGKRRFVIFY